MGSRAEGPVREGEIADQPTAPRKLPQARMYLKSARWGFDRLLEKMPSGYEYRFYMIGILAALRAVQHSLYAHDRKLSPAQGGRRHPSAITRIFNLSTGRVIKC
jgi:hypothetical protein